MQYTGMRLCYFLPKYGSKVALICHEALRSANTTRIHIDQKSSKKALFLCSKTFEPFFGTLQNWSVAERQLSNNFSGFRFEILQIVPLSSGNAKFLLEKYPKYSELEQDESNLLFNFSQRFLSLVMNLYTNSSIVKYSVHSKQCHKIYV